MQNKENLKYAKGTHNFRAPAGLPCFTGKMLEEVASFLKGRAEAAQLIGIPRWHVLIDPGEHRAQSILVSYTCAPEGLGFAKKPKHSLHILRNFDKLHKLTGDTYASLIGASRKGFIGTVLSQPVSAELCSS